MYLWISMLHVILRSKDSICHTASAAQITGQMHRIQKWKISQTQHNCTPILYDNLYALLTTRKNISLYWIISKHSANWNSFRNIRFNLSLAEFFKFSFTWMTEKRETDILKLFPEIPSAHREDIHSSPTITFKNNWYPGWSFHEHGKVMPDSSIMLACSVLAQNSSSSSSLFLSTLKCLIPDPQSSRSLERGGCRRRSRQFPV